MVQVVQRLTSGTRKTKQRDGAEWCEVLRVWSFYFLSWCLFSMQGNFKKKTHQISRWIVLTSCWFLCFQGSLVLLFL